MSKKQDVAVKQDSSIAVSTDMPDFLKDKQSTRGSEGVGANDLIIPRLELVQALSPARDRSSSSYIDGATEGMLFNNVTKVLYGEEVIVVPVYYKKQWLIWKDRKQGGGANGFRGAFDSKAEADDQINVLNEPGLEAIETAQHFCLLVTPSGFEEIVVSMAKTKFKVSKRWNSLIKLGGGDSFSRAYKLRSIMETNARNEKYYNLDVSMLGFVNQPAYVAAERLYDQVSRGSVAVSHDYDGERVVNDTPEY